MFNRILSLAILIFSALFDQQQCLAQQTIFSTEIKQIDRILFNRGVGFETNNQVRSELNNQYSPDSKVAYFKYYLKSFLKSDATFSFDEIERDIKASQQAGQQFAFRLMAFSEEEGSEVLKYFGANNGYAYRYDDGGFRSKVLWAADLDNIKTQEVLFELLTKLGLRYNLDPRLLYVDIGLIGLWGEWHTSDTVPKVPMPSLETQKEFIDQYFKVFPNKKLIMQIQEPEALAYAVSKGAGMRADCLADANTYMMKRYPKTIATAKAELAWHKAPMIFEICWRLDDWLKRSWDYSKIFDLALSYHPSLINTKSTVIPSKIYPEFQYFLKKLGFRLVINKFELVREAKNDKLIARIAWTNVGSAPCYNQYFSYLRFTNSQGFQKIVKGDYNLCQLLTGEFLEQLTFTAPFTELKNTTIEVGLGSLNANKPEVDLAIHLEKHEYWYRLGVIE